MGELVVLAIIITAIWCLCSKGGNRPAGQAYPITARNRDAAASARRNQPRAYGGWSAGHVRRHEERHLRVAQALGCTARIEYDGDRPVCRVISGPPLTPAQHAAIAYAGGPGGHEDDHDIAEGHLRKLPASQRAAARAEAKRIARRYR
jgi:hypothetical protein